MLNFLRNYLANPEQAKLFASQFVGAVQNSAQVGADKHGRDEYLGIVSAAEMVNLEVISSVVDIASGDGVSQSAIWPILQSNAECTGLGVEVDSRSFSMLSMVWTKFPRIALARLKVTPGNVSTLISAANLQKNFDLLNLDIDSFDLEVMQGILQGDWRPKIVSMEINEKFPPSVHFSVRYSPEFIWNEDHFYGCSIAAATELLARYGYEPIDLRGNNLIAVPKNSLPESWKPKTVAKLYEEGYLQRRKETGHFAWNSNVDYWQEMAPTDLLEEIPKFFSQYSKELYELAVAVPNG